MTTSPSRTAILPVPAPPPPDGGHDPARPVAFTAGHHFSLAAGADPATLAKTAAAPRPA